MKNKIDKLSISDYLDNDYKEYAIYVIEHRAIPSVIDGFKPTQRKIVYVSNNIWKNGNGKPLKIFQLSGKVASDANYHHGDASVSNAIISMAQDFKNSLPLFDRIGQFGSLRSPEAGAPRYISTKLNENFNLVYKDFDLLEHKIDEGMKIEPYYFLPIIPMVLINGGSGIAVGFASNIINRNPVEVTRACLNVLDNKRYNEPKPWINGFNGKCYKDNESWVFEGTYEIVNTTTLKITELPPSMTYKKFEELLVKLEENGIIQSYVDSSRTNIEYVIKMKRSVLGSMSHDDIIKTFKLSEKQTDLFTVLDENGKLKIFNSSKDIISYFIDFRLKFYDKRKAKMIKDLEIELNVLSNKARFIKSIIDRKLKVNNVKREIIIKWLNDNKFDKINDSYNYLLSMPIHTLTKERYEELLNQEKENKKRLNSIKKKKPIEMYKEDLQVLLKTLK